MADNINPSNNPKGSSDKDRDEKTPSNSSDSSKTPPLPEIPKLNKTNKHGSPVESTQDNIFKPISTPPPSAKPTESTPPAQFNFTQNVKPPQFGQIPPTPSANTPQPPINSPQVNLSQTSPGSNGSSQQPQFGGQNQQPQFGANQPPQFGGPSQQPPQFGGPSQPQQFGGQNQQPQFGANQPPQFGGPSQQPPQNQPTPPPPPTATFQPPSYTQQQRNVPSVNTDFSNNFTPSGSSLNNDFNFDRQMNTVPVGDSNFEVLKGRTQSPQQGWRKYAGKVLPVKKSAKELEYDRKIANINKHLREPQSVGIICFKGGVGKSTISAGIGSTFAEHRSEGGVVGVDADHFGSLASRVTQDTPRSQIRAFLQDPNLHGSADTESHLVRNHHRFGVLPSSQAPDAPTLTPEEFEYISYQLKRHYRVLVVDTDTSASAPALPSIVKSLNALVIVTSASKDGAAGAMGAISWLRAQGLADLIGRTVIVVNRPSSANEKIDLKKLQNHFEKREGIKVFYVPWDPHFHEAATVDLDLLDKETRLALVDICSAISAYFH